MAAGDLAQAQAGFVPALSSDDLRLGFGKIDEAADLAFKYGALSFASSTALLAFTGAAVGQRAVDRASGNEYRWSGTAWQLWSTPSWVAYTPSWSGLTVGNGTVLAHYKMTDGLVFVRILATLGSTSAVTGPVIVTLPFTAASTDTVLYGGHFAGTSTVPLVLHGLTSATQARLRYLSVSGALVVGSDTSAGAPFTWAAGNQILANLAYRSY